MDYVWTLIAGPDCYARARIVSSLGQRSQEVVVFPGDETTFTLHPVKDQFGRVLPLKHGLPFTIEVTPMQGPAKDGPSKESMAEEVLVVKTRKDPVKKVLNKPKKGKKA